MKLAIPFPPHTIITPIVAMVISHAVSMCEGEEVIFPHVFMVLGLFMMQECPCGGRRSIRLSDNTLSLVSTSWRCGGGGCRSRGVPNANISGMN